MKVNFYGLCNRETGFLSNIFMSGDDKEAAKWMLETLSKSIDEVEDETEKSRFITNVRDCTIVKIGDLDVLTHGMSEDFNVLVDLRDFKKEVEKENGTA